MKLLIRTLAEINIMIASVVIVAVAVMTAQATNVAKQTILQMSSIIFVIE